MNLFRTLRGHIVRKSLDGATSTLKVVILEQHLLQFRVRLADVAKLVVPLVDGGIREPLGSSTRLILLNFTTMHSLVVERNRIVPWLVSDCSSCR